MWFRLLSIRVLSLVALGVSAAQFADYLSEAGAFCDFGEGCEQVTGSVYGNPLGIPLSAVGFFGFVALYTLTLVPARWAFQLFRAGAVLAGVAGAGLMVIQFAVLHKVCPLCLIVDSCSILIGLSAAGRLPEPSLPSRFRLIGWLAAPAVAALIPVCWTAAVIPDPVPLAVQELRVPGEITIVDVVDFECPHCKQADAVVRDVMSRHKEVKLVRLVCPMPLHENGPAAARAYIAARKLGKGEEMSAALFAADSHKPADCRAIAAQIGLKLEDYDRELNDPSTDQEHHRTITWVRGAGKGLPLIWVQEKLIKGTPTVEILEEAIRTARRFERPPGS